MKSRLLNFPSPATGHPEIDADHVRLDSLIATLGTLCDVRDDDHELCREELADLLFELMGFMVGHFATEERLMKRLPPGDASRTHIERHTLVHAQLSERVLGLARDLDHQDPRRCAARLHQLVSVWMGVHLTGMDAELAQGLRAAERAEIDWDHELAAMLAA